MDERLEVYSPVSDSTPTKEFIDLWEDRAEEIAQEKRERLRVKGWLFTPDTPCDIWLWEKTLPDGRVILTSEYLAVKIQAALESRGEE